MRSRWSWIVELSHYDQYAEIGDLVRLSDAGLRRLVRDERAVRNSRVRLPFHERLYRRKHPSPPLTIQAANKVSALYDRRVAEYLNEESPLWSESYSS